MKISAWSLLVEKRGVVGTSLANRSRTSPLTFDPLHLGKYARRAVPGRKEHRRRGRAFACLGFPASPGLAEETMLDSLAEDLRLDYHRPTFHVAPRSGWVNDPNGPFYHQGEYHLFYQHIVNGCEWDFGIVWGHAVSRDLIHWEHLAHALLPDPGGPDADGCFSGCSVVDTDGTPTILYTGVRLRSNPECGPLPPSECDLNLPFIESQLVAIADAGDDSLETWTKLEEPMIATPPPSMPLVGWRDPYIFETMGSDNKREWGMLLGSGIKGQGGSVMIYRSENLRSGWRYDGMLCEASDLDSGAMWECPLLIQLNQVPQDAAPTSKASMQALGRAFNNMAAFSERTEVDSAKSPSAAAANHPVNDNVKEAENDDGTGRESTQRGSVLGESGRPIVELTSEETSTSGQGVPHTHFLCVSPDAPTNPVLYWLGNFDLESTRFLLEGAKGPLRLDLGDILYAPNLMVDDQGRHILWGWLQERRKVGSYDYAGCMSVPRILYLKGDRLIQEPAPEVAGLRRGKAWEASDLRIVPEESLPLEGVSGPAMEIQATFERGSSDAVGILVRSWNASGEGGAAIVYDFDRGYLETIFEGESDLAGQTRLDEIQESQKRIGGRVDMREGEQLTMRLLLDGSCVEVYLGSGEVLSTRIYRGDAPKGADSGVDFVAFGGKARVKQVEAWEMASIWQQERSQKLPARARDGRMFEASAVMGAPIPV